jgi:hypothetical protein
MESMALAIYFSANITVWLVCAGIALGSKVRRAS